MSVTFWTPDAPTRTEDCPYCVEARAEGCCWGYTHLDGRVTCDKFCSGQTSVSDGPELNVSNSTAAAMLRSIGVEVDGDAYGTIPAARCSELLRGTIRAVNTDAPEAHVIEPSDERGEGGCRVVGIGLDADRIRDRLGRLQDVLVYAAQHGYDVHYG